MIDLVSPKTELVRPSERRWLPKSLLGQSILKALPHLPRDLAAEIIERISATFVAESELRLTVMRGYGLFKAGLIPWADVRFEPYGVVSRRVVTDAGVAFLVNAFQNTVEPESLKFHGIGTGTTAEATTDTALVTELTTEYAPDNTRATGSTTSAAANIYKTVATNTLDSGTPAVTEHGIFDNATRGSGTLLDRSKFAAINLTGANGDGLQSDYRLTLASGG